MAVEVAVVTVLSALHGDCQIAKTNSDLPGPPARIEALGHTVNLEPAAAATPEPASGRPSRHAITAQDSGNLLLTIPPPLSPMP
jgi:hypothetical protein